MLATKFGTAMDDEGRLKGASRRYIMSAVEASLRRLNTDWIDLYQLHWPDPATPIEETLRALDDLVRHGKVRYLGSSNMRGCQVMEAHRTALSHNLNRFISAQNEYSLLRRCAEHAAIPAMQACGVGLLPYFPLASGLLTGKYRRDFIPEGTRLATPRPHEVVFRDKADWALIDALDSYCRERGRTLLELAFSWLLARPVIASVIAGATTPEQLELNAKAAGWTLTPGQQGDIDRLTGRNRALVTPAQSFDDLVDAQQERFRDREAERLRGLEVDDQLELARLLHRQVGGLRALQDPVHVGGAAPKQVGQARAVGHEAAGNHVLPRLEHARQPVAASGNR